MKTKVICLLGLAILVVALAFSVAAPAAPHTAATTVSAVAASQPATVNAPAAERHPEIHDALVSLRHAREHMAHAAHDYHGHREEALRATDEAIRQLEICEKFE